MQNTGGNNNRIPAGPFNGNSIQEQMKRFPPGIRDNNQMQQQRNDAIAPGNAVGNRIPAGPFNGNQIQSQMNQAAGPGNIIGNINRSLNTNMFQQQMCEATAPEQNERLLNQPGFPIGQLRPQGVFLGSRIPRGPLDPDRFQQQMNQAMGSTNNRNLRLNNQFGLPIGQVRRPGDPLPVNPGSQAPDRWGAFSLPLANSNRSLFGPRPLNPGPPPMMIQNGGIPPVGGANIGSIGNSQPPDDGDSVMGGTNESVGDAPAQGEGLSQVGDSNRGVSSRSAEEGWDSPMGNTNESLPPALNPGEGSGIPHPDIPMQSIESDVLDPGPGPEVMANTMDTCFFATAMYSLGPEEKPLISPCHVFSVPKRPDALYKVAIRTTAHLCTPTWGGAPLEACVEQGESYRSAREHLLAHLHVQVVLTEDQARHGASPMLTSDGASPQPPQLQGQLLMNLPVALNKPEVTNYVPARDEKDIWGTFGGILVHRHSTEADAFPGILVPGVGFLATTDDIKLAVGRIVESMEEKFAANGGFINAIRGELRKALRWSMVNLPDFDGEDAVIDESRFATLDGEFLEAVRDLKADFVIDGLAEGFLRLRRLARQYQIDKNDIWKIAGQPRQPFA